MYKRIMALLLCLLLMGSAQAAVEGRVTVDDSDILSAGALRALNTWLHDAYMTVQTADSAQQLTLYQAGEKLLEAAADGNESTLTAGAWTAKAEVQSFISLEDASLQALSIAQALGNLLHDYEKSANATAELGNVVKAKTQLSYALSAEQWAAIWPEVCQIIGAQFADVTLESKGTLRRYFASDGSEIGAYFYAEKVRVAEGDVREVRLEYAYQAEKDLYLAFRCPNKNESRNLRISCTVKRTERTDRTSYAVSCDVRRKYDGEQDTVLLQASFKEQENVFSGKATLDYTQKRDDKTIKYAVTAAPEITLPCSGTVAFEVTVGDLTALEGEIHLNSAVDADIAMPKVNADITQVQRETTLRLFTYLQQIPDNDRLELIYYLNRPAYLTGEEADVYLMYDPEFTVTEEP